LFRLLELIGIDNRKRELYDIGIEYGCNLGLIFGPVNRYDIGTRYG
jgi:hypothetical protein